MPYKLPKAPPRIFPPADTRLDYPADFDPGATFDYSANLPVEDDNAKLGVLLRRTARNAYLQLGSVGQLLNWKWDGSPPTEPGWYDMTPAVGQTPVLSAALYLPARGYKKSCLLRKPRLALVVKLVDLTDEDVIRDALASAADQYGAAVVLADCANSRGSVAPLSGLPIAAREEAADFGTDDFHILRATVSAYTFAPADDFAGGRLLALHFMWANDQNFWYVSGEFDNNVATYTDRYDILAAEAAGIAAATAKFDYYKMRLFIGTPVLDIDTATPPRIGASPEYHAHQTGNVDNLAAAVGGLGVMDVSPIGYAEVTTDSGTGAAFDLGDVTAAITDSFDAAFGEQ